MSGYVRAAQTDDQGNFRFDNVPFNNYHVSVTAGGFQAAEQDADARSPVPLELKISLKLGASSTSVTVSAEARD